MNSIKLMTYSQGSVLPVLPGKLFPHSTELFRVYEQTPGYAPIMIVVSLNEKIVAKLLAVVRRSMRFFPPSIIKRCEVYGVGEYFDDALNREEVFGQMLEHLTNEVLGNCFLIEFRNLPSSLFGYRFFRKNSYFNLNWLRVYNSLHSLPPEERLDSSLRRKIKRSARLGVEIKVAETKEEVEDYLKMLRKNYSSKIRKHFPHLKLFRLLIFENADSSETAKVFLVKYKGKIIGGSFCIYSGETAFLCFSGGLRKRYAMLYPGTMAIWGAIKYAYENKYTHFEFVDAGLPFTKVGYRNFILGFGGKQVSTRRWFRFRWTWLNKLADWVYRQGNKNKVPFCGCNLWLQYSE